jgi:hypothetical protein
MFDKLLQISTVEMISSDFLTTLYTKTEIPVL